MPPVRRWSQTPPPSKPLGGSAASNGYREVDQRSRRIEQQAERDDLQHRVAARGIDELGKEGEKEETAASPAAIRAMCTSVPTPIPSADTMPAGRPSPAPRAATYSMSGPGVRLSARPAARKSAIE